MDKNTLYRFFEGNCAEDEIQCVRRWVESSSGNKAEFLRESKMYDMLLMHPPLASPVKPQRSIVFSAFFRELMKIAAIIALIATGIGIYYASSSEAEASLATIHVPTGKNANIVLPDGSSVWLNANTTFEYSTVFNHKKREVFLDGEAYFDVKPDKKKTFIVKTKKYDVEVLGTSFNVEAYSDKDKFITSLMEGSVKITSSADGSDLLILQPMQAVFFENGELITRNIDDYNIFRWREGLICFDNTPFKAVIEEFEKHFELEINIENKTVEEYLCTGKFRQIDGAEYALRILQKDAEFTFERESGTNIIHIK